MSVLVSLRLLFVSLCVFLLSASLFVSSLEAHSHPHRKCGRAAPTVCGREMLLANLR
jgi:hypothetical protein